MWWWVCNRQKPACRTNLWANPLRAVFPVRHLAIPRTVVRRIPLSLGFSRRECQRGFPFPIPGDLPNPGIQPSSLESLTLAGRFFTPEPLGTLLGRLAWAAFRSKGCKLGRVQPQSRQLVYWPEDGERFLADVHCSGAKFLSSVNREFT